MEWQATRRRWLLAAGIEDVDHGGGNERRDRRAERGGPVPRCDHDLWQVCADRIGVREVQAREAARDEARAADPLLVVRVLVQCARFG